MPGGCATVWHCRASGEDKNSQQCPQERSCTLGLNPMKTMMVIRRMQETINHIITVALGHLNHLVKECNSEHRNSKDISVLSSSRSPDFRQVPRVENTTLSSESLPFMLSFPTPRPPYTRIYLLSLSYSRIYAQKLLDPFLCIEDRVRHDAL